MTEIVHLAISHFRGIKNLELKFNPDQRLICFIGRGDSGKTTILEAISFALSPAWNLTFNDSDFYGCALDYQIDIQVTLVNFPEQLLSEEKCGLHIRGYDSEQKIVVDDIASADITAPLVPAITIRLRVDESLEPQWLITTNRTQDDKRISASSRALLKCFMISDYVDRHFSWSKGNPLYALFKSLKSEDNFTQGNIVLSSLREAKKKIDEIGFQSLDGATRAVELQARELGLDISDVSTTLDFRDVSIKGERVSLHNRTIPLRQKGKGSKRLASLAI